MCRNAQDDGGPGELLAEQLAHLLHWGRHGLPWITFMGLPWPMNSTGMRAVLGRLARLGSAVAASVAPVVRVAIVEVT